MYTNDRLDKELLLFNCNFISRLNIAIFIYRLTKVERKEIIKSVEK